MYGIYKEYIGIEPSKWKIRIIGNFKLNIYSTNTFKIFNTLRMHSVYTYFRNMFVQGM